MFSGIIQELGTIKKIIVKNNIKTFKIKFKNSIKCNIGDSVAINGTCLTVTQLDKDCLIADFDTVPETLIKTNLDFLKIDDTVNTELSLCYGDKVGGHMVQGHIDEKGMIKDMQDLTGAWLIQISASKEFLKYLIKKGFVTIDGMSITIIDVFKDFFTVTLIPHTTEITIAKNYTKGSIVNLEADATGKYIYKYTQGVNKNV